SLGCPKNLADTEVLMGKLAAAGHTIVNNPAAAEMIVVNTCAFLQPARAEALKVIREMARWKKKGKCRKLYIAGCLPKTRYALRVTHYVDGIIDSIGLFDSCTPRVKATPPWYAYVKIAEGCDNCCSYCLIPKIRGRLRTRKMADVLKEVRGLAKRGVKEIIYVAQDTTAYPHFAGLLKATARIAGLRWVRIMYAHPEHVTDELIKVIAAEKKIVKYLDLPLQHVNDRILRRMNRRYDKKQLIGLIVKLRKLIPGLTLRTTLIVGFPGEGEKEFRELADFVRWARFDRLGVFPYFREAGTPASRLSGQVPDRVKNNRAAAIMRLQSGIAKENNRALIGRTIEAVVEGKGIGRSAADAPEIDNRVRLSDKRLKPGQFVTARVLKAAAHDLLVRPL
ncbi:MAG TPA: MiaB/RimO family radical SAM methylthiotransferase, partial [Candidatus Sulfotelmatobacter sp.]|nr:MiaB/RimO family radical SAM methylthiotransferase [Candidatus Sulfotelmatobacter sp.]